jgi:hypothetical protein
MYAVKSPEEAEFVVGAVQQIQPTVKQQEGRYGGDRRRLVQTVQQSESALFSPPGDIGDEWGASSATADALSNPRVMFRAA